MKIIKLTTGPYSLTQKEFNCYTEGNNGAVGPYRFEVNNDCNACDYWVVRGNLLKNHECVNCDKVVFLLDEVHEKRDLLHGYLEQFDAFIGLQPPTARVPYIFSNEIMPWFAFLNKTFNEVYADLNPLLKTNDLCIMSSDANYISGHTTRYAFTNQLIGHFKDKVKIYGRGFIPFDCKYEILKNYKYCVAMENTVVPDYFTEKINECYLCETLPIYYGCPNLGKYYDEQSFVKIDIRDMATSIKIIEELIENKAYETKLGIIKEMKKRYFASYHFPHALLRLLEKNIPLNGKRNRKTIFQESHFISSKIGVQKLTEGFSILKNGMSLRVSNAFKR